LKSPHSRSAALAATAIAAAVAPVPAAAWGDLGHNVTALIAYRHLLPRARARLDAMLASDSDSLTAADFAARATWADKYRNAHRETAAWHFIDIEIDQPDLASACFGFAPLARDQVASHGPARDCIVNKIDEFTAELANPATVPAERTLALKFLIHFVGDLHQPLHTADHRDKGGNCVTLAAPIGGTMNLHAYWDVAVVAALGSSASQIADQLEASLDAAQIKDWSQGTPRSWALDSFELGRRRTYAIPAKPTCQNTGSVSLSSDYQAQAQKDAAMQLLKAGVRLAAVLNTTLGTQ
jgi:hypothetical protein